MVSEAGVEDEEAREEQGAAGLVAAALSAFASWSQKCSDELGGVCNSSDKAFSDLALALSRLSSAVSAAAEGGSISEGLRVGPAVLKLQDALDAEARAREQSSNLLKSLPTKSVRRALCAVRTAVLSASKQAQSLTDLQERLRGLLPSLQAPRPDPGSVRALDKRLKRLKRQLRNLTTEIQDCTEDGDLEEAAEAQVKRVQVQEELAHVNKERRNLLASSLTLLDQFPELVHPGSEHCVESLKMVSF
jgi:hypothetical protein